MTFAGYGYALKQDRAGCERAYAQAQELLQQADASPAYRWAKSIDSSYVEVQRARSLDCFGEYRTAVEIFQSAIPCIPPGYHRDRGVYLAREARAHAGNGDAEQAAAVGLQALTIGGETRSARIVRELTYLDSALSPQRSLPGVIEFRAAMNDMLPYRRDERAPNDSVCLHGPPVDEAGHRDLPPVPAESQRLLRGSCHR